MISFEYELKSYRQFINDFALLLETTVTNDRLNIPPGKGKGYLQAIDLAGGLEGLVSNFYLDDDILLERKKQHDEFYTFICEELTDISEFTVKIGSEISSITGRQRSAMYLTSFLHGVSYFLSKGTNVSGIRVYLNPAWMEENLQVNRKKDALVRYLELKTAGIWYRNVDAESRQMITEIIGAGQKEMPPIFYSTRILKMIEKFCGWLNAEMVLLPDRKDISREDIDRLMAAEQELLSDFSLPAPTITHLSKKAAMSESKFKRIFKTIYGRPVYSYYQDHRMEKARVLLLSGKYSVSEVGYEVGYANLSNFSMAFRKKFNKLPSEIR